MPYAISRVYIKYRWIDTVAKCSAGGQSPRAIIASPAPVKGEQVSLNRSDMRQMLFVEQLICVAPMLGGST
jgi:hypothetical protein